MAVRLEKTRAELENVLLQEIVELYGRESRELTDITILGSDVNQISHLFLYLKWQNKRVQLTYGLEQYSAEVLSVDGAYATLKVPDFDEGSFRRILIQFDAMNVYYQFEVIMTSVSGNIIEFRMPDQIQSATRRKYRRIYTEAVYMRFLLEYQPLFGKRGVGQLVEDRYYPIVAELKKDYPDLSLILRIISEEIQRLSDSYEFKFYQKGDKKSLMEQVIGSQQATLYIRDTGRIESYINKINQFGLINFEREFKNMLNAMEESEARDHFESLQKQEMRDHIYTYVASPLSIFDRTIGHIYVYTSVLDKRMIAAEDAQIIDILSRLLSYGMSKTAVSQTYYRAPLAKVKNLSMAGLLFEVQNPVLFEYLLDHDRLRVFLPLVNELLEFETEITRLFPSGKSYSVGLRFVEAGPDDYRILENYLYNRIQSNIRQGVS